MTTVELCMRVHLLTGKFPTFTKEEAEELKRLLKRLDEAMDDEWKQNHFGN